MRYEFTGNTMEFDGHTLREIRYLDHEGRGGWIEKRENYTGGYLSHDSKVYGDAVVSGGLVYSSVFRDRATMTNGWVMDCVMSMDAKIRGGFMKRCKISCAGEVLGGDLMDTKIVGSAQVSGNPTVIDCFLGGRSTVRGAGYVIEHRTIKGEIVV